MGHICRASVETVPPYVPRGAVAENDIWFTFVLRISFYHALMIIAIAIAIAAADW